MFKGFLENDDQQDDCLDLSDDNGDDADEYPEIFHKYDSNTLFFDHAHLIRLSGLSASQI